MPERGFLVDLLAIAYGFINRKKLPVMCGYFVVSILTFMPYLIAVHLVPIQYGRITFIYHYFPAILFVILMMGYTIDRIKERFPWGRKATAIYLAAAILCFFLWMTLSIRFLYGEYPTTGIKHRT